MYYAIRFSEKERLSITDIDDLPGEVLYSNKDEKPVIAFIKGFTLKGNTNADEFSVRDNNGNTYTFLLWNGEWKLYRYALANSRFVSELPLGDSKNVFYVKR